MTDNKSGKLGRIVLIIGVIIGCLVIGLGATGLFLKYILFDSGTDSYYNSAGYGSTDSALQKSITVEESDLAAVPEAAKSDGRGGGASSAAPLDGGDLTEQKVIKTGDLTIQVKEVGEAVNKISDLAEQQGGFVLSSDVVTYTDGEKSATVVIKVPSDKFNSSLETVKAQAELVKKENISGQDVTEEYTDLQAQLKNYRAEEAQLTEFLERAGNVEELLSVSSALSAVRENIEITEGRIKYLEGMTDMSTITVVIHQEAKVAVPSEEWQPGETVKTSVQSLLRGLEGLVDLLIVFLIVVLPFVIIFGLGIWLIVYIIKKIVTRKRNNN